MKYLKEELQKWSDDYLKLRIGDIKKELSVIAKELGQLTKEHKRRQREQSALIKQVMTQVEIQQEPTEKLQFIGWMFDYDFEGIGLAAYQVESGLHAGAYLIRVEYVHERKHLFNITVRNGIVTTKPTKVYRFNTDDELKDWEIEFWDTKFYEFPSVEQAFKELLIEMGVPI